MRRPRSSAIPLALLYVLLVIYASLYPFVGWTWPPGHSLTSLMRLQWPHWHQSFDIFANLAGYLPLGALVYVAGVRSAWSSALAGALALLGPALLSYVTEMTQNFIPGRVPSLEDWLYNTLGAALGLLLAAALHATGLLNRWQALRDRWFASSSGGARVLMLIWPIALLFPTPVPLGLGQLGDALRQLVEAALEDTPLAEPAGQWLATSGDALPLSPASEWLAITLGLLAPCLLVDAAMRPGVRRIVLAAGAALLAFAFTTLSAALNFGPSHSLAWLTPTTLPALVSGFVLAAALAWIPRRLAAGLGLVALTALVVLVAQAPSDPYFAESLQAWQQGRFIRFHGLARWIGLLWPYCAMAWLLRRMAGREAP